MEKLDPTIKHDPATLSFIHDATSDKVVKIFDRIKVQLSIQQVEENSSVSVQSQKLNVKWIEPPSSLASALLFTEKEIKSGKRDTKLSHIKEATVKKEGRSSTKNDIPTKRKSIE
jgi:hypothetical protein